MFHLQLYIDDFYSPSSSAQIRQQEYVLLVVPNLATEYENRPDKKRYSSYFSEIISYIVTVYNPDALFILVVFLLS